MTVLSRVVVGEAQHGAEAQARIASALSLSIVVLHDCDDQERGIYHGHLPTTQ
jgi:hypothetical protein